MGKGSSQAPTSSTVTQTNLPSYAQPYFTQLMGQSAAQAATPYQQYQGQQVANFSPMQQAAFGALSNMQPIPGAANTAGQIATNVANQAAGFNPQFDVNQVAPQSQVQAQQTGVQNWTQPGTAAQYMSPYTQNVMSAQQALMNQAYQQNLNQINTQAAQAGAFGGDRQAIADQQAAQNYNLGLANMQAQALQNAYGQGQNTFLASQGQGLQSQIANQQAALQAAMGNVGYGMQGQLANQQQNLAAQNLAAQYGLGGLQTQLGAGSQLGALAPSMQNMGLNYLSAVQGAGNVQQQQQQQLLNTAYNNWANAQNWNWSQLGNLGNILHGVPVSPSVTQTNMQAAPSMVGMLGGLGALATGAGKLAGG